MNNEIQTKLRTAACLLTVCTGLTLYGIWGPAYDWFTGARVVVIFILSAMFAKALEFYGHPLAKFYKQGAAALALVVGGHLLAPYFWPGRIHDLKLFVVFWITALIAWGVLITVMWIPKAMDRAFKTLCVLPLTLLMGCILATRVDYGNFFAPALNSGIYIVIGASLMYTGIKRASRIYFNGGIAVFCMLFVAASVTFLFELPGIVQQGLLAGLILILNIFYTKLKEGGK